MLKGGVREASARMILRTGNARLRCLICNVFEFLWLIESIILLEHWRQMRSDDLDPRTRQGGEDNQFDDN